MPFTIDCNLASTIGPFLALMFRGTNLRPSLILVATQNSCDWVIYR